ncbi:MAG TPA: glycosyltransferase family 39 protein, partial [Phototrophicaceae bacterium]|nr:glycosyltransferase family 39 protein [Phototrophicaceae bacterium]
MTIAKAAEQVQIYIKTSAINLNRTLLVLGVIVVLAFGVRLLTFDRYLPFLDYNDESNMYLLARDWRGVEAVPVVPEWLAGYPPLYIWVNMLVQEAVEAHWPRPWIFPSEYFYYTRLLSAIFGGLTAFVIMLLGWELGGSIAAAFAGSVWALSPLVVNYNSLAIPDPLVYLACALALVTAIRAWKTRSPLWLLGSLVAGIIVTYAKYEAVFALIPCGLTLLVLLFQQPRRWLRWLVVYLAVGLLTAAYLIFGYGALNLNNREAASVRGGWLSNILMLRSHLN